MPRVDTLLYFLHLVAAVFWIGGIGYILFVLMPAVTTVALRDRARFMPIVLRRYLVVVWISIAVLAGTGLYRMFMVWDAAASGFWATGLGHTLAGKLVLVVVLIGIAVRLTADTVPQAIRHVHTHLGEPAEAYRCAQCATLMGGMRRRLQLALLIGLAIIYLAVMLRGA